MKRKPWVYWPILAVMFALLSLDPTGWVRWLWPCAAAGLFVYLLVTLRPVNRFKWLYVVGGCILAGAAPFFGSLWVLCAVGLVGLVGLSVVEWLWERGRSHSHTVDM